MQAREQKGDPTIALALNEYQLRQEDGDVRVPDLEGRTGAMLGERETQEPRPGAIEDPVPCHHSNKRRGKATRQGGQAVELQEYISRSRGCREFRSELFLESGLC